MKLVNTGERNGMSRAYKRETLRRWESNRSHLEKRRLEIKRLHARALARERRAQFSYRSGLDGRLDRASSRTRGGRGMFVEDRNAEELVDRSLALQESNPIAKGSVDRLCQILIGTGYRFLAKSGDETWNKIHSKLWAQWSDNCDVRNMNDLGGLQNMTVQGMLVQARMGWVLLKSGQVQLIEGTRFRTPPGKEFERVVDGVVMNSIGKPLGYWVLKDEDQFSNAMEDYVFVPARHMVYFPLRWRSGDTIGEPIFAQSFDNLEQVDAVVEAVTAASQIVADIALLITQDITEEELDHATELGEDSQGNPARLQDYEPASVEYLRPGEKMEQIKAEHPQEHLGEFIEQNLRYAHMPLGVASEILTNDFRKQNYAVSRAMRVAAFSYADWFYALHLARNFRRIYQWRTSKWIKEGLLPERDDAWLHRHIPSKRPLLDAKAELQADAVGLDLNVLSIIELAERQGMTAKEMLDEVALGKAMLAERDLTEVRSSATRNEKDGAAQAPDEQGDSNG